MSIVVLKLPNVKRKREERPKKCPYCGGETFQRWGQVKDLRVRHVKVYRYRCCHCRRTFRHYPRGNSRADQTERLRLFAVILWKLGLSYRANSLVLGGLNVLVSFMTLWLVTRFANSMSAAGWEKRSKHYKKRSLKIGCGYSMRSTNSLTRYHQKAANACIPFGSDCLVVSPNPTSPVPPWNNYAICYCT